MENPISVIGSAYCVPKPIKLSIDTVKGVTHIDNRLIFQFEKPSFSLHKRRLLRDFSGNPVLNLKKKSMTLHDRWQVFKRDSKDSDDLVFSVKRSSSKNNVDLEVFLAKNSEERVWDYRVNAGSAKSSCDIYAHGSSTILAKMTNRGSFVGEVQPNVDYALIVALITIVDNEINCSGLKVGKAIKGSLVAADGVLGVASLGLTVASMINMDDDAAADDDMTNMDDDAAADDDMTNMDDDAAADDDMTNMDDDEDVAQEEDGV